MKIDRVHFYVEDALASRNWFVRHLGFQAVASGASSHTCTEVVRSGSVYFVLSAPLTPDSPVAEFLKWHPPGVADLAFIVQDLEAVMDRAVKLGAKVLQPIGQKVNGSCRWGKIAAWGSLSHTLIDAKRQGSREASFMVDCSWFRIHSNEQSTINNQLFTNIDHVVLNVAAGDLEGAARWYENTLGFESQQSFAIQTARSALHSKVMVHPNTLVKLPINEPASANSQIQEFLDLNRGAGIQHIALQTPNIVDAIALLRHKGLPFLPVPPTYYTQLKQRQGLQLSEAEIGAIAREQILVDWEADTPHALLLQIFTQPIFQQPTFFFELIERRFQARGFGEGNFRALFEAIEREQMKRGSLQ